MAGEFIHTLGDSSGFKGLLNGKFLKGHGSPRIAIVGRSNVGKSSLINVLMGGRLARVSKEPGKTRAIHFYLWKDADRIIADLPGYGYARTGHDERERWANFINLYLKQDVNLERALVLLDSRHGPTQLDLEAIGFLSLKGIPVTFVLTKSDQLKNQAERARRKKEVQEALGALGVSMDNVFWVSSETRNGIKELAKTLGQER